MPRPTETLQAEESTVPKSPLRRSCRIICVSSPVPSENIPKGRRLSISSEKEDEDGQTLRTKRASSVTKENSESKVEPVKTRTRRSSASSESSVKEDEKNVQAARIKSSQSIEEKTFKTRRSSVNVEEETKIEEDPVKRPSKARRSSVLDEKENHAHVKKVGRRRGSTQDAPEEGQELPQRDTRNRRSASRDLTDETEETKASKNLKPTENSEKDKESESKRLTRSRRSSTDKLEGEIVIQLVKTPIKTKRRPSITDLVVNLESIDEKEIETESPLKQDSSKQTPAKKKQPNLELSVICETSFVDDMEQKRTTPRPSPTLRKEKLENDTETSYKSEKTFKESKETTLSKNESNSVLPTGSEDGRQTPETVAVRKSPRIQEKLEKCKSGEHALHKKCSCEDESTNRSCTKIIEFGEKDKSDSEKSQLQETDILKTDQKIVTDKKENSDGDIEDVLLLNTNVGPKKDETHTHISEGSDGSFIMHLSKNKLDSTDGEADLNDSKTSNSSDKENTIGAEKNTTPSTTVTATKSDTQQNIIVRRVSNVFRPKNINYSFVEPMDVDTTVNLDNSKMEPQIKSESDETFSLNLSATYIDIPEEDVMLENSIHNKSQIKSKEHSEEKKEKTTTNKFHPETENVAEEETPQLNSSTFKTERANEHLVNVEDNITVHREEQSKLAKETCEKSDVIELSEEDDIFSETKDMSDDYEFDIPSDVDKPRPNRPKITDESLKIDDKSDETSELLQTSENVKKYPEELKGPENEKTDVATCDDDKLTENKEFDVKSNLEVYSENLKQTENEEVDDSTRNADIRSENLEQTENKKIDDCTTVEDDSETLKQTENKVGDSTCNVEVDSEKLKQTENEEVGDSTFNVEVDSENLKQAQNEEINENFCDNKPTENEEIGDGTCNVEVDSENLKQAENEEIDVETCDEVENDTMKANKEMPSVNESTDKREDVVQESSKTQSDETNDKNETEETHKNKNKVDDGFVDMETSFQDIVQDETKDTETQENMKSETEQIEEITTDCKVQNKSPISNKLANKKSKKLKRINVTAVVEEEALESGTKILDETSFKNTNRSKKIVRKPDLTPEQPVPKKKTLEQILGRETKENDSWSSKRSKITEGCSKNVDDHDADLPKVKGLEDIISSKSPDLDCSKTRRQLKQEETHKLFSLDRWFGTSTDNNLEESEDKNSKSKTSQKKKRRSIEENITICESEDKKIQKKATTTNKSTLEEFASAKLDEFLERKMAEFEDDEEDATDSNDESDEEESSFVDDMAEEGEEDTPSEDSNAIIDEGELILTDSERSDEDDQDDDSFICDEEHNELLPGDEYDLGNFKKKSRILNVEDQDDDIIKIEKKPKPELKRKRSRIISVLDSSDSEEQQVDVISDKDEVIAENSATKKSSIRIIENINVKEIKDTVLSERINQLVDSFCTTIPQKADVSMNLSLEYVGLDTPNPSTVKQESKKRRNRNRKQKNASEEVVPFKQRKLSHSFTEEGINEADTSGKRRLSKSMEDIGAEVKKRKIKKLKQKCSRKHLSSSDTSTSLEDFKYETLGLINQLVGDVKNRPRRAMMPSTTETEDPNASWSVELDVDVKPSTSVVSKKEIEAFKKHKIHPKDFRIRMLSDSSRVRRMDTKTLLRKKGAYY